LKAKLRNNFSLEKMIVAEKIFQKQLAAKINTSESNQFQSTKKGQLLVESKHTTSANPNATEQTTSSVSQVKEDESIDKTNLSASISGPSTRPKEPVQAQGSSQPHTSSVSNDKSFSEAKSSSKHDTSKPNDSKSRQTTIEIVYSPGPLEKLFGSIGLFFDKLFGQEGKTIRRTRH
jgi:hypothetical protein